MRLLEANIEGFGQYRKRKITFDKGLNVLYGANESGKTTLLKFIEGVLYGFYKPVIPRQYMPEHEKYRPWDGGTYAGTLIYEENGQKIAIYRDFDRDLVKMTNVLTGEDLTGQLVFNGEIQQVDPAQRDWKLSHSAFRNTICIAQGNAQPEIREINAELEESLRNIMETGDQSLSVERSMNSIKERLREIEGNGNDKEDQINLLERKLKDLAQRIEQQKAIEKQKKRMNWELTQLPDCVEDPEDAAQICEELGSEEQKSHLKSIQEEIENLEKQASQTSSGPALSDESFASEEKKNSFWIRFVIPGVLTAIILVLAILISPWVLGALVVPAAILFFGNQHQQKIDLEKQRCEYDHKMKEALDELSVRVSKENRENQIGHLKLQYREWICKYATGILQNRKQSLETRLRELKEENLEELLEQQRKTQSEKDMMILERDSLHAAAQAIELLSQDVRKEFTPALTARMKETVGKMTLGRYNTVYVSPDRGVQTVSNTGKEISLDRVSAGTGDQIYLAVRMEMADLISPGVHLPVILDDAFARYDEERLENCLRFLAGKADDTQILIFSCQIREKELLESMKVPFAFHRLGR